jgi:pilus assembly protein CpaF
VLTVHKFPTRSFELDDLVSIGTLTEGRRIPQRLRAGSRQHPHQRWYRHRQTTLLNVLSGMIPETDRIVTIEDAAELRLKQRHV